MADELALHFSRTPGAQFTVYAISPDDYAVMVGNQAETIRYVQDLRAVVEYYRTVK